MPAPFPSYDDIDVQEPSSLPISRNRRVFDLLFVIGSLGTIAATIYLATTYFVTTTEKVLAQQLPIFQNETPRIILNTLGVPGTCLRYLSQMVNLTINLKDTIRDIKESETSLIRKTVQYSILLATGIKTGMGAYKITEIQAKEYKIEYTPPGLSIAIPAFVGVMQGSESLLGSLNSRKILPFSRYFVKGKDSEQRFNENFYPLHITRVLSIIGILLISFSFLTVVDELMRDIFMIDEDSINIKNIMLFIFSVLGFFTQSLLDVEKMIEIIGKIHNKELGVFSSFLTLLFSTASSSLNFVVGYRFLGTTTIIHSARVGCGIMAALPKMETIFTFLNSAVEKIIVIAKEPLNKIRESVRQDEEAPLLVELSYPSPTPS